MRQFVLIIILGCILVGCKSLPNSHYFNPNVPQATFYKERHEFSLRLNEELQLESILGLYDLRAVAVNLSHSVGDEKQATKVKAMLVDYGVEPRSITIHSVSDDVIKRENNLLMVIYAWDVKTQECNPDSVMKHSFDLGCYVELNRFKQLVSPRKLLRSN